MSDLTDPQLAYLRTELGSTLNEDDLQDRYDRLGSAVAVAAEVIRERRANLLSEPTSFAVPGVYSESTSEAAIKALLEQSARLDAQAQQEATLAAGGGGNRRLVRTDRVR